jgi:dTDP-4-amino-4,6-dideoxygalactose transaminase
MVTGTCPLVWPYCLPPAELTSCLRAMQEIASTGSYRSDRGWAAQVVHLLRETVGLAEDWSALPLRSGTDSLSLALTAAGVRAGDLVGVPDLAYHVVGGAVLRLGAVPLWLDVDAETWNVDRGSIEEAMDKKPSAVIGVDNYGTPCDWEGLRGVCRERGVPLILDCCESLGGTHPGGGPSTFADSVVYSFSFTKVINAAGAGGALAAPSEVIRRISSLPELAAWQATLPEINAAFLVHAWPDLMSGVGYLNLLYRRYAEALVPLGAIPQRVLSGATSTRIHAPFLFPADSWGLTTSELSAHLAARGVETRSYFPLQSRLFRLPPTPSTGDRISSEVLCLPMGSSMPEGWVDEVVASLSQANIT